MNVTDNPGTNHRKRGDTLSMCQSLKKPYAILLGLTLSLSGMTETAAAQIGEHPRPNPTLRQRIQQAFNSPVGHWTIIKMDVDLSEVEAELGYQEEKNIRSFLVDGSFDVDDEGRISGSGRVVYHVRAEAGARSPVPIPVGAMAVGGGERDFSISGRADLKKQTVSLDAFQPHGDPLKLAVVPGQRLSQEESVEFALWPPMTNIETGLVVHGAAVLIRAAGTVGQFKCSFEAVKYVDLQLLLEALTEHPQLQDPNADNSGQHGEQTPPEHKDGDTRVVQFDGRSGTTVVAPGESVDVVFSRPLNSPRYAVSLTPAGVPRAANTLAYSHKTSAGFRITLDSAATGHVHVDWLAIPFQ